MMYRTLLLLAAALLLATLSGCSYTGWALRTHDNHGITWGHKLTLDDDARDVTRQEATQ